MVRLSRYPSDLTDAPWWVLLEPLLPPLSKDGQRPKHGRRDLVEAICYVDHTGCAWRALPVGFLPWQTVYGYVACWQAAGATKRRRDGLRGRLRLARDAAPTRPPSDRLPERERC